jgi:SAM-dependent methyltransferase
MDYSDAGCELLRRRGNHLAIEIEVVNSDLFQPPEDLIGGFDVVYSAGLVEHFANLGDVLAALARFLRPGGELVTIIPNMHGILGPLTKRWNKEVYDIHNPHSLATFLAGHADAGLQVIRSGYLCSSNFGVLSACFQGGARKGAGTYKWLSRLTKALWWYESRAFELPKTAWLSPYMYAISRASTIQSASA